THDLTPIRMAERLREELLHMIVHDLRNPIASIRTALDFVLVEGLGPLTSEQQEVLRIARDNTDRILRMVHTILDLRRLEAGKMALQPKPLALAALVGEILRGMQPLLQEKDLRVRVELPEGLPPAWGDEEVLSRVLQNLLDNAIKLTPSGGSIWVRADVAREDGRPWIQVTVADSGPGIPSGLRERLFQPFVTGMVPYRGVGLGLAFCRLAVEAHGGKIWVEDHPSGGAAFVFTIPVAPDRSASG
ncbi:MAG: histidine kinase, partial [Thermoflexus sp.]